MKKILFLLLPFFLFAKSPFETPPPHQYDLSMFNTPNKEKTKERKFECRFVCDEKLSKERKIEKALSFYKKR